MGLLCLTPVPAESRVSRVEAAAHRPPFGRAGCRAHSQGLFGTKLVRSYARRAARGSGMRCLQALTACPVRDSNPPHRIKSPALYQMS